jgi:hypothetical protein
MTDIRCIVAELPVNPFDLADGRTPTPRTGGSRWLTS